MDLKFIIEIRGYEQGTSQAIDTADIEDAIHVMLDENYDDGTVIVSEA